MLFRPKQPEQRPNETGLSSIFGAAMDLEFILIFTLFTLVCIFPICRYFIDWVPACLGRQWAMYKVRLAAFTCPSSQLTCALPSLFHQQWAHMRYMQRHGRVFKEREAHSKSTRPGGVRPGRPRNEIGKADDSLKAKARDMGHRKKKKRKKHRNPTIDVQPGQRTIHPT